MCGIKFDADASNLVQQEAFTLTAILLICLRCQLHFMLERPQHQCDVNIWTGLLFSEGGGEGRGGSAATEPPG